MAYCAINSVNMWLFSLPCKYYYWKSATYETEAMFSPPQCLPVELLGRTETFLMYALEWSLGSKTQTFLPSFIQFTRKQWGEPSAGVVIMASWQSSLVQHAFWHSLWSEISVRWAEKFAPASQDFGFKPWFSSVNEHSSWARTIPVPKRQIEAKRNNWAMPRWLWVRL